VSYDLYLLRPTAGKDPLKEAEEIFSEDADEINPGIPDPQKDAMKRELARQLQLINPSLEVFQFDYSEIAKSLKISEQAAQIQYRHIEINEADGGKGIRSRYMMTQRHLQFPIGTQEKRQPRYGVRHGNTLTV
jgi:hypothetical protein